MLLRLTGLAFMLLLLFSSASAQIVDLGKMRFGIRGGLSAANLLFVEAPNKFAGDCPESSTGGCLGNGDTSFYTFNYEGGMGNTRLGLTGGLFVERIMSDNLSLEMGVNYEQKGIKLKYKEYSIVSFGSGTRQDWKYYERDIRNDYLVVPVLVNYKLSPSSRYYVSAGIYTAFLLNSAGMATDSIKSIAVDGGNQSSMMLRFDQVAETDNTNLFDAGFIAGGGAAWPLGNQLELSLDARLNVGVLKVDRNHNNRFEKYPIATSTGYGFMVISENYYRGLNSQTRNISLNINIGISKKF